MAWRMILGLAVALAPAAVAQEHLASGVITQSGKTLHLKSAVAVWDDTEKTLTIGLFPFEVDERDVRIVVADGAQPLAATKPSPDPALWRESPVGGIIVRFRKRPGELKLDEVEELSVRAHGLIDPEKTFAFSRRTEAQFQREVSEFRGNLTQDGGEVRLLLAGSDYVSGQYMDWNIRVQSPIYHKGR